MKKTLLLLPIIGLVLVLTRTNPISSGIDLLLVKKKLLDEG